MLQPTRSKYRKAHKGRIHGKATRVSTLNYGTYGLKAMQPERIIGKQIEAAMSSVNKTYGENREGLVKDFPKYTSI